jgi:Family of unknown function (DUF5362)
LEAAATIYMIIFIIIGAVFFISGIFSMRFGNKISVALKANDQNSLRDAFAAVRNFFAFRTIIMIIWLLLILIIVIGVMNQPNYGGRYD